MAVRLPFVRIRSRDETKGRLRRGVRICGDSNAACMVTWSLAGDHLDYDVHAFSYVAISGRRFVCDLDQGKRGSRSAPPAARALTAPILHQRVVG